MMELGEQMPDNRNSADNKSLCDALEKYFVRLPSGLQNAITFIVQNYAHGICRKELARSAGMSEHYFGKAFKKKLGFSYVTFIQAYRIQEAKKLLLDSNLSVGDIARQVGFKDVTSFNRVFRALENTSPLSFRSNVPLNELLAGHSSQESLNLFTGTVGKIIDSAPPAGPHQPKDLQ